MKIIKKIFLLGAILSMVAFVGCSEDDLIQPEPSPAAPEGTQGVYFPSSNKSVFEFMPVDPTEFELKIARSKSEGAVDVPLTQEVNDDNVFVVPSSVSFAAGETETTFKVTFPNAVVGKTYKLKLKVEGDEYVNPYVEGLPFLETSAMRVEWKPVKEPMVYVDGTFNAWFNIGQHPMYVYAEKAVLGKVTRYRFKNVYKVPVVGADEDGIFDGYPYNEAGDFDESKDYITTIEIGGEKGAANEVFMYAHEIGVEWSYGMHSIGSVYGNLKGNDGPLKKEDYPLGVFKDGIITFPEKSLYHRLANEGIRVAEKTQTTIYLTKEIFLKANKAIKDFNDLEYTEIEGAVSEYESKAYSESWTQPLAKAVDVDKENPESDYKNLYYFSNLYAKGYGLAFYANDGKILIPEKQMTGTEVFGHKLYVSQSEEIKSSFEVNEKGVTVYTLGLMFHYGDGTIVGDFAEKFYYSKDPVSYTITDFVGDYTMTGTTLFKNGEDASMAVKIAKEGSQKLVITGVDYADKIIAKFNPRTSEMSIEPQKLADITLGGNTYDVNLLTIDRNNDMETGYPIQLSMSIAGNIVTKPTSQAIGYLLFSQIGEGYLDGYHSLMFTRSASPQATSTPAYYDFNIYSTTKLLRNIKTDAKINNFSVKGKKVTPNNRKLIKNSGEPFVLK